MSGEAQLRFECFGGTASVHVRGAPGGDDEAVAAAARATLLEAHAILTRFDPESELSRFNRDMRILVPASPLMRRLAAAVGVAGELSGGLVDATLLGEVEAAGYAESLTPTHHPPSHDRPTAQPAGEDGGCVPGGWRTVSVDEGAGVVCRPPGVRIDSGGLAKGLLADLVAESLAGAATFAVDCCGDIRVGGSAGRPRRIRVEGPHGGEPIHELAVSDGAVATSGTTRRSWIGPGGSRAHHLIDPRSGCPAATGVVQATALAPTGLLAEVYAKAALLSGPEGGAEWLPFGGVLVGEDGAVEVVPAREGSLAEPVAAALS